MNVVDAAGEPPERAGLTGAGVTAAELAHALPGMPVVDYMMCSPYASDDELRDVLAAGVKVMSYGAARHLGVSHDDALTAAGLGVDLLDYAYCRQFGDTHDEAAAGLAAAGRFYRQQRTEGKRRDAIGLADKIGVPVFESATVVNGLADLVAGGVSEEVVALAWVFYGRDGSRFHSLAMTRLREIAELFTPLGSSPEALRLASSLAPDWAGEAAELVSACLDSVAS